MNKAIYEAPQIYVAYLTTQRRILSVSEQQPTVGVSSYNVHEYTEE
jgi:hypothetical protein